MSAVHFQCIANSQGENTAKEEEKELKGIK